ncbi:hypothetical protein MTY_1261 [Moorella thermoacetica Y72]|uniref:Uncharacterized protein n=1 Tax=Moorella thermoacetica Y72 TaxID=1325331 RepID=A0A0S6UCB7_NEOTH|nr:hypothetical protein MTY_1261 [Moorella thermoacetica Y72]
MAIKEGHFLLSATHGFLHALRPVFPARLSL